MSPTLMACTINFSGLLLLIWHDMLTWMAHDGYSIKFISYFHGLMTCMFSMWELYLVGGGVFLLMACDCFLLEFPCSSKYYWYYWLSLLIEHSPCLSIFCTCQGML